MVVGTWFVTLLAILFGWPVAYVNRGNRQCAVAYKYRGLEYVVQLYRDELAARNEAPELKDMGISDHYYMKSEKAPWPQK